MRVTVSIITFAFERDRQYVIITCIDSLMRLPLKVSTTTSNFMIGVTAAASAGIYFSRGDIPPLLTAPVALGILIGALIGGACWRI